MSDMIERKFYDACLHEGMERDSYALAAALRAFRRWRPELDRLERDIEKRLTAKIERLRKENHRLRELPEEPGPRYSAGEYSRRNHAAMIEDALAYSIETEREYRERTGPHDTNFIGDFVG